MNVLNCLIIEGKIRKVNPLIDLLEGITYEVFEIETERFYKDIAGEMHKEVSVFNVRTVGKMAEVVEQNAKKGRGVRVVGRLKQRVYTNPKTKKKSSEIYVVAEHIEFKPMYKKEN